MISLTRRAFVVGGIGTVTVGSMPSMIAANPLPQTSEEQKLAAEKANRLSPESGTDQIPETEESSELSADDKRLHEEAKKAAREASDPRTHGFGTLQLYRQATGESMAVKYRTEEGYYRDALAELSWFWRDVADADQAVWIDPALLDFVSSVQSTMATIHGSMLPFILTSGYRTPVHNSSIEGAARNSQHLYGRAGDFKVPGYPARSIGIAGLAFKGGGVGFYSTFTHLDVGELRCWPRGCNNMVAHNG